MVYREEQNDEPRNEEILEEGGRNNDRQRNQRQRQRISPLALQGEQQQSPNLSIGILLIFNGDGIVNPNKHLDHFLIICDIHGLVHDVVMVKVFMQTLIGPTYD